MVALIRTDDIDIRTQQWARMSEATTQLCEALHEIRIMRSYLSSVDALQTLEWWKNPPEVTVLKALAICQKRAALRLKVATEACSSLQSELSGLQTALSGQEEE